MVKEKGITLTSLVITVMLLGVLIALVINVSMYSKLIQKRFQTEQEYNELMEDVEENIESIRIQWEDVLN